MDQMLFLIAATAACTTLKGHKSQTRLRPVGTTARGAMPRLGLASSFAVSAAPEAGRRETWGEIDLRNVLNS